MNNDYIHNLMHSKEEPKTETKQRGFYLYRCGNPERIYALVIHDTHSPETLDMSDITSASNKTYLLDALTWPKHKDITIQLNKEVVKMLKSKCKYFPLDDRAKKSIEEKISTALRSFNIKNNSQQYECPDDDLEFFGYIKSLAEEVLKHKNQWLDIFDVYSIFFEFVSEYTQDMEDKDGKVNKENLWDILGEEKGNKLKVSLKEYLLNIPRDYAIYIPLSTRSQDVSLNIKISGNISIRAFKESSELPDGFGVNCLNTNICTSLKLGRVYLVQYLQGYCGKRLESFSNKQALKNLKTILQQGIAKQIFTIKEAEAELGLRTLIYHTEIEKVPVISLDGAREPLKLKKAEFPELPLNISQWLNKVDFNWEKKSLVSETSKDNVERLIHSELKEIVKLINCNSEESNQIVSAIQWCFNAYITEDKTLAFIQTCIGLEALLGDDTSEGDLTKTLADRYSYLICSDIKERKLYMKKFKKMYNFRSRIVHGSITELGADQEHLLKWGIGILNKAIIKEIKNLNLQNTKL